VNKPCFVTFFGSFSSNSKSGASKKLAPALFRNATNIFLLDPHFERLSVSALETKLNSETAEAVVEAAYAAWNTGDIEALLSLHADDLITQANTVDPSGEAKVTNGKQEFRDYCTKMQADFESATAVNSFKFANDVAYIQVSAVTRHRSTDLVLEGTYRQLLHFRGFKICRSETFHDAAKISAFWRLLLSEAPETRRWLKTKV
jgi:ketosteroid isomerase-like protein